MSRKTLKLHCVNIFLFHTILRIKAQSCHHHLTAVHHQIQQLSLIVRPPQLYSQIQMIHLAHLVHLVPQYLGSDVNYVNSGLKMQPS